MRLRLVSLWVVGVCLSISLGLAAQQPDTPAASGPVSVVPRLVSFGGVLKDHTGKVAAGVVNLTFSLYEFQEGGTPLWTETQSLQLDEQGRYTVLLGASAPTGLPLELFTTGRARWLGVQPGLSGVGELPRALLAGVPYAVKAADADTLGGQPASAYMLVPTNASSQAGGTSVAVGTTVVVTQPASASAPGVSSNLSSAPVPLTSCTSVTSDGTAVANQIAKFTAPCNITKSAMSETSGKVSIAGSLQLPSTGTATATKGFNSQPTDWLASSYNNSTKKAVSQDFRWQAEPAGNNTASPSGTLNLLFGANGVVPAETGFSISSKGIINFASGQTLPTVTGNETVTGNVSATQLVSTVATGTAPLSVASTTQVPNLNASLLGGLPASAFQPAGSYATLGANNFTGNQSVTGNASATGAVSGGSGTFSGSSFSQLLTVTQTGTGTAAVFSSPGATVLEADSTGGTGLRGATTGTSATAVVGIASSNAAGSSASGVSGSTMSQFGSGVAGSSGNSTSTGAGIWGGSRSTIGPAGLFTNFAGGPIILGTNNGVQRLLVDGGGNVTATGTGSFNAIAVNSNAQVANLNASLLGGFFPSAFQPAGAYATLGANNFTGNQSVTGNLSSTGAVSGGSGTFNGSGQVDSAGVNGGAPTPGVVFGAGASGETISSNRTNNTAGANFQGLDFYTASNPRLSITNSGSVGIGTRAPSATLNVVSSTFADGIDVVGFSAASGSGTVGIKTTGGNSTGNYLAGSGITATGGGAMTSTFYNGGTGVIATGGNSNTQGGDGIDAFPGTGSSGKGLAGNFYGDVNVQGNGIFHQDVNITGNLTAFSKNFKIDHPLDPANKYLFHASIESSDVMNLYNGNAVLDKHGRAWIELPEWFQALNREFRYQLTAIGAPGPNLYIAKEVEANRFQIAGGKPGMKVSWQVTGIRQDPYVEAHRMKVEQEKPADERGYYLNPEAYGQPKEKGIQYAHHRQPPRPLDSKRQPATPSGSAGH
jgi:trimeric autotransporter adhesin